MIKAGILGGLGFVAFNEIRGLLMAGPVLYAMWVNGGTWTQAYLLLCIAASAILPALLWRTYRRLKQPK